MALKTKMTATAAASFQTFAPANGEMIVRKISSAQITVETRAIFEEVRGENNVWFL